MRVNISDKLKIIPQEFTMEQHERFPLQKNFAALNYLVQSMGSSSV